MKYNDEKVEEIERSVREWVDQQFQSESKQTTAYFVNGISFSATKEGIPSSHWAVGVGKYIYHLVFEFKGLNGVRQLSPQGVKFKRDLIENVDEQHQKIPVGPTHFKPDQILAIGEYLITKFGRYHQVFWNCQNFARILCRVLTGKEPPDDLKVAVQKMEGFLFRIPLSGQASIQTLRALIHGNEESVRKSMDKEFVEIIEYLAAASDSNLDIKAPPPQSQSVCVII